MILHLHPSGLRKYFHILTLFLWFPDKEFSLDFLLNFLQDCLPVLLYHITGNAPVISFYSIWSFIWSYKSISLNHKFTYFWICILDTKKAPFSVTYQSHFNLSLPFSLSLFLFGCIPFKHQHQESTSQLDFFLIISWILTGTAALSPSFDILQQTAQILSYLFLCGTPE